METAITPERAVASRTASCLWCHATAKHAEIVRNHGLCEFCAHQDEDIGWRVVYDRDRKVGAIPANLRAAYKL
jgi:hypothetical protein